VYVLGVWDGHDAGAALVENDRVIYAANEERFTKRKLEVNFPTNAINAALRHARIKHSDVTEIAFTTTEFTKTLERVFPQMKENYYKFRRRKMLKPSFENFRHNLKYEMTSIGVLPLCNGTSSFIVSRKLKHMGFKNFKLHVVDHHTAHAATAGFTAPFRKSLIITLDGLGDGLSGSVSILEGSKLKRHSVIGAKDSLGIFYEQVTNILGMRELEDEGKIMAMADYSYPFPMESNELRDFFSVVGTSIRARYNPRQQFNMLQRIAWHIPREQFAYMAQQVTEHITKKFTENVIGKYGISDVAYAGGLFANVKANMQMRNVDSLKHWHVFPHMGDGGIALGSAMYVNYLLNGVSEYKFDAYTGSDYNEAETEAALKKDDSFIYQHEPMHEQASHAAELLHEGNYLLWFHGRMEYGPRALGNRSILAPSGSEEVKERLNLYVKKREWFQPFAPSMLEEEAGRMLEYDGKGPDKFMTNTYFVKKELRNDFKPITHIDGSARPQMVGEENRPYQELLRHVKRNDGYGVVLNTSFNIHGMPIVMSPEDALETMRVTKAKYMFLNDFFVINKNGV
jgi:carbamoyltransferase